MRAFTPRRRSSARKPKSSEARNGRAPVAQPPVADYRPAARQPGDWLERQAEEAVLAVRAAMNAPGDARSPPRLQSIAPAPAPPLSGGAPLPAAARAHIERALDADVGGVAVHTGPAAAALARQLGARAFAAGRHIVVGDGEDARAGFVELLAHEVAHVLQQAGRRGPDGRLRVVDARGGGAIQRVPIAVPDTTTIPSLADIGARHVAADTPAEPGLQRYVQDIEADVAARGETAAIDDLASEATTGVATNSARPSIDTLHWKHKSYVVDLLKRAGRPNTVNAAVSLLHSQALRTAFTSDALYQRLVATHPTDVDPGTRWASLHVFNGMRADDFTLAALQYLVGVTRPIQAVGGGPGILNTELSAVDAPSAILSIPSAAGREPANERDYAIIAAVKRLHAWQAEKLAELARAVTTPTTDPRALDPVQRREVARRLHTWASAVQASREPVPAAEPDEVQALIRLLVPGYTAVAARAIAVVDGVLGPADRPPAERLAAQRATLASGANLAEFTAFRTAYTPRFEALLALDADGNIPAQSVFATAHQRLSHGLLRHLQLEFELRGYSYVRSALMAEARGRTYAGPSGLAHLAMARQLAELHRLLGDYHADADRAMETELAPHRQPAAAASPPGAPVPQPGVPDHRVRHRIVIARWLTEVAGAVGWTDLARLGDAVAHSRQAGPGGAIQPHSYLALLGHWRESEDQRINRLTEDFASGDEIGGFRPLTAGDLVAFFQMLYYQDLTARVTRILGADRAASRVGETSVLSRAIAENRAQFVGPRRHEHEGLAEYAIRPGDEGRFGQLVINHPLTRKYIADNQLATARDNAIQPHSVTRPPFFWLLPSLEPLVARLRSPLLDDLVLAYQNAERARTPRPRPSAPPTAESPAAPESESETEPAIDRVRAMSWFEWLVALSRALTAGATLGPSGSAEIERFHARTRELRQLAVDAFYAATRASTSYDRVGRVDRVIRPLINQYDRHSEMSQVTVDVSGAAPRAGIVYEIPDLVIAEIDRFMGIVSPPGDQTAQVSAMLLELANDLSRLLGVAAGDSLDSVTGVRFRIVMGLRPILGEVIRFVGGRDTSADGRARRALLDAVLPSAERAETWIEPRLDRLRQIKAALDRVMVAGQQMFGFRGVKVNATAASRENFFESVGPGSRIMLGAAFTIDGVRYRVRELEHNIEYHEPYGTGEARLNSTLAVDGRTLSWADRAGDRTRLFTLEIGRPDNVRTITAHQSDDDLLTVISRAVQMFAIAESLRELGEALETFSMLMIDAAEFIPGAGQAVMVARLAMFVTQFIASGEMDELIALVRDDPRALLERVETMLGPLLRPQILLEFFLFGVNHLSELGRSSGRDPSTRPIVSRGGNRGRLARVVRRIWSFGRNLLAAFGRVQGRVRHRAERAQMFLLSRRYVPRVLRFVSDNLPRIAAVTERLTHFVDDAPSPADAVAFIQTAMADVPGTLSTFLDDLETIRLPYNLIDPADILHIIVDLVVRRLGGKYRIAVGMMLTLLDRLGFRRDIERAIANRLVGAWDPNDLYRGMFGTPDGAGRVTEGPLVTPLKTVRDDIVGGVLGAIGRVPFLPADIRTAFATEATGIAARPFAIQFSREGFEGESDEAEMEGYGARPLDRGASPSSPLVTAGAGAPLPPRQRLDAEARFGHDFSHVRLHGSAEGASLTRRFGAQALTSGSHIFVRPDIALSAGHGRDVLHHELTHVLQQGGPRPLGGAHDGRPIIGAPGRGLRVDPAREAAADRVASSLRHGAATSPIDVGAPGAHGLQPTFGEPWIQRVMDLMTATAGPAPATTPAATGSHLPAEIRDQVRNVATDLEARLRAAPGASGAVYESPWNHASVHTRIRDYLLESGRWTAIRAAIEPLARDATRPRATPTTGTAAPASGSTATTTAPRDLDIPDFEAQISRRVLDLTGILVHVDFPSPQQAAPAPLRMGAVRVVTIHLPMISSNAWLFQQAINQLEHALQARVTPIPNLSRNRVLRWTQTYLEGRRGVEASNWTTSTTAPFFKLANSVVNDIADLLTANAGSQPLDAANLPPAAEYADINPRNTIQGGQVGLRVGVFGDAAQRGPERESHHVTQYILLEYFSNLHSSVKAFPHAAQPALYGGSGASNAMTTAGSPPQVIGFGSIGLPTSLAGTSASQRGPGMPAVLLSAPTHRNARLHIHNSPEDFFGASLTETGSANILRAWYHGQLRARLPAFVPAPAAPTAPSATSAPAAGPVVPTAAPAAPAATPLDFVAAEDAGPMAMQAYIANRPANVTEAAQRQRIADGIEHAMKATYARIRDFMQPRLRTGLYTAERQYYRTAAEGAGHASSSAHQLTPMQVSRVFSAAVARNTQVLETDNHWA